MGFAIKNSTLLSGVTNHKRARNSEKHKDGESKKQSFEGKNEQDDGCHNWTEDSGNRSDCSLKTDDLSIPPAYLFEEIGFGHDFNHRRADSRGE